MRKSETPHPPKPKHRHLRWWVFLGCFLLLAGIVGTTLVVWVRQAERDVQEEIARIHAAGEPITPDDVARMAAVSPGKQDLSNAWLAAIADIEGPAFQQVASSLPLLGAADAPLPGDPWPDFALTQAAMDKLAPKLKALHDVAGREGEVDFHVAYNDGLMAIVSHVQWVRQAYRLLALEAHARAYQGDAHGAMQSIRHAIAAAETLKNEPLIISQLVRASLVTLALRKYQQLQPRVEFSDDDLRALQADLRRIDLRDGLRRAMLGERMMGAVVFRDGPTEFVVDDVPLTWRLSRGYEFALFLEHMGGLIDALDNPWPEALAAAERQEESLQIRLESKNVLTRWQHSITAQLLPNLKDTFSAVARADVHVHGSDAAAAVELYRRRERKLPTKLDELVPDFLPAIPADPYDGAPLRFIVRPPGYVIYSVGADKGDSGGVDSSANRTGEPDIAITIEVRAE